MYFCVLKIIDIGFCLISCFFMCIIIYYFLVLFNLIWVFFFVLFFSLINDVVKVNKVVFMFVVYIFFYLKRYDDVYVYNILNIDVLYDFYLIYILYENINF